MIIFGNVIRFFCSLSLCSSVNNIVDLMGGLEVIRQDKLHFFVHIRICWGKCAVETPR